MTAGAGYADTRIHSAQPHHPGYPIGPGSRQIAILWFKTALAEIRRAASQISRALPEPISANRARLIFIPGPSP